MSLFDIGPALLRASVAGGLAALGAWLVTTAFRTRLSASHRAWIWWLVAAHFLVALIPTQRIVLPSTATARSIPVVATPIRIATEQTEVLTARVTEPVTDRAKDRSEAWMVLLLGTWLAGVVLAAVLHIRALRRIDRAWDDAEPYAPASGEALFLQGVKAGGKEPELRVTSHFDVPVTLAGRGPRILLPAEFPTLPPESRMLVLAHECAHVARRDLLLGWLPAAAEALFWFHPLARWASREYGQAREEACDARALVSTESSPRAYGELLLHFGVAPRPLSTASCGSPTRGALLRRLLMLDSNRSASGWGRFSGLALITLVAVSLAPFRLQAGSRKEHEGESNVPPPLQIERFAYLLVEPGGNTMGGAMKMGGGYDDVETAKKAQKKMGGGRVWWFRLDGSNYGVNDTETIQSVAAVYAKQDELQKDLLAVYDERLELLSGRMERLHPKLERLEHRRQEIEKEQEDLEEARDEGKSKTDLERRMQELDRSRQELERSYEPLSSEQEQISREMERVTEDREKAYVTWEKQELEYRARLRKIAEDAVRSGVARKL
jgi:bla regulator protein blaR1